MSDEEDTEPSPRSRLAQITRIPHPRASPRSPPLSHTAFPFKDSPSSPSTHLRTPSQSQIASLKEPSPTAITTKSPAASASAHDSQTTARTTTSRPEGWWSSDDIGTTAPNTPEKDTAGASTNTTTTAVKPRRSFDSLGSTNGRQSRFGERGISLGSAKAVSEVVRGEGHGESGAVEGVEKGVLVGKEREKEKEKGKEGKARGKRRSASGIPVPGSK